MTHAKGAKGATVLGTTALAAMLEPPHVGCYKLGGAVALGAMAEDSWLKSAILNFKKSQ